MKKKQMEQPSEKLASLKKFMWKLLLLKAIPRILFNLLFHKLSDNLGN